MGRAAAAAEEAALLAHLEEMSRLEAERAGTVGFWPSPWSPRIYLYEVSGDVCNGGSDGGSYGGSYGGLGGDDLRRPSHHFLNVSVPASTLTQTLDEEEERAFPRRQAALVRAADRALPSPVGAAERHATRSAQRVGAGSGGRCALLAAELEARPSPSSAPSASRRAATRSAPSLTPRARARSRSVAADQE